MPTERAHGIQVAKMCEAFAELGYDVELIVPDRKTNIIEKDVFEYYKVKRNFKITKLWCLDHNALGRARFLLQTLTFLMRATVYSLSKRGIFYTRDSFVAALLKLVGKNVVWEAHMGIRNIFSKFIFATKVPVVVITTGLKTLYVSSGGKSETIHVSPDGVDIDQFSISEGYTQEDELFLNKGRKKVVYTGHLYPWKGAHTLALASANIDADVILVGGTDKDIDTFKSMYGHIGNLKILGMKPHREIPLYIHQADVLVLPNSGKKDISKSYTSPMKLFEYMTSKKPIVASDLPSIREILTEKESYFFKPDDHADLAKVINYALVHIEESKLKGLMAYKLVQKYSWRERAEGIINFLNE